MTAADTVIERRLEIFHRWQPCGLLAISVGLAAATAGVMTGAAERSAVVLLVAAALVLQLWWVRVARAHPEPDTATVVHFAVRWSIAFALTWLNGFFAFYTCAGYFDAGRLIPGRRARMLGLFACSVPVAAAQTAGTPFHGSAEWGVFAGLLLANNAVLAIVDHFFEQGEERSRSRAAAIAELERANAALQRALDENAALHDQLVVQAREAGIADERGRLAAEIHDTIAQGLTGIIAQLRVVENATDPAAAREHGHRAADLARHCLGEARRSVRNLAPAGLAHDELPEALRKTVVRWAGRTGVRAGFTLTGTPRHLPEEVSATLLRIAEEALANVAKHASAFRVGVTLSFMDGEVALDVRDDGRGFDPPAPPEHTGGFGLAGMRARAERVAGALSVESEPGYGTAVSARVALG